MIRPVQATHTTFRGALIRYGATSAQGSQASAATAAAAAGAGVGAGQPTESPGGPASRIRLWRRCPLSESELSGIRAAELRSGRLSAAGPGLRPALSCARLRAAGIWTTVAATAGRSLRGRQLTRWLRSAASGVRQRLPSIPAERSLRGRLSATAAGIRSAAATAPHATARTRRRRRLDCAAAR